MKFLIRLYLNGILLGITLVCFRIHLYSIGLTSLILSMLYLSYIFVERGIVS